MNLNPQERPGMFPEIGDDDAAKNIDTSSVSQEKLNVPVELGVDNKKVQEVLDEMNQLAFENKKPPPTEKEKTGAVASFVVATGAAVFVPGIPWAITWLVVFVGMSFLLQYMREE